MLLKIRKTTNKYGKSHPNLSSIQMYTTCTNMDTEMPDGFFTLSSFLKFSDFLILPDIS